jgi:hypothetical protein
MTTSKVFMAAFDPTVLPQFVERKGSLTLRSDHMTYGRATLNSNWHQAREAEPKDYDIGADVNARNLHKATYDRLSNDDVSALASQSQTWGTKILKNYNMWLNQYIVYLSSIWTQY